MTVVTIRQLHQDIQAYWQLPFHQDPILARYLYEVQAWQRQRLAVTHQALFAEPKHQAMGRFLIHRLYGGEDFDGLARQIEKVLTKAEKLEKFIPQNALETGIAGVQESITAIKLDLALASYLYKQQLPVNETTMIQAYRTVDASEDRRAQIARLKLMCYRTDKYLKSFVLQKAFALAKSTAYKHQFAVLYDFIGEGFAAMKPIKSLTDFIEPFCEQELIIINNVHSGNDKPFMTNNS